MPYADADGVRLYFEEAGSGSPVIFAHEFATDHRGWEPQMRYFSRRYRCVAFNARGYPPSDVPDDPEAYSQQIATDDIAHVLRHLGIGKAHVVGLSMGGNATLQFGLDHADKALSLVVAGGGYGSIAEHTEQFRADARGMAERYETEGPAAVAEFYSQSPSRVQYRDKDPRGWAEFRATLEQHDAKGAALTMRGVQARRPSFWEFEDRLRLMTVPLLIISGDEDDWCLDASLYLKRAAPTAALWVLPKTGHTINLEESDAFNRGLQDFFDTVEAGRWITRDLGALGKSAFFAGENT
jgi:pimeloyl-ACP methyl ester carboxylesterase